MSSLISVLNSGIFPEPEYPARAAAGDGGQVRRGEDLHLHGLD